MRSIAAVFCSYLIISLISSTNAKGDFYEYTFTGVIPDGVSNHSQVADGEIWTAIMVVDSTTPDSNPDPQFGVYKGAVVSGTLEFSGGYTPFVDFAGANAFALDDVFTPADSVSVRGEFNSSNYVFQANTEILTTLDSDALVGPGTSFDSFPNPSISEYFVFTFADEFGDIVYTGDVANNSSFSARAIPEPATGAVLLTTMLLACRRRKR